MTKKYNKMKNITGDFLHSEIKNKGFKQKEVIEKLELLGISINRQQLSQIENHDLLLKDFELIGLCIVLDIDMNKLKDLIRE